MNKDKSIYLIILLFLSLTLVGCENENTNNNTTSQETIKENDNYNKETIKGNLEQINNSSNIEVDSTSNENNDSTSKTTDKVLSIDNRCIGCRRCVNIAGNAFEMKGRFAEVKDPYIKIDSKVQSAINNCPVDSIEIIEI